MKLFCRTYSSEKPEELYQAPIIFLHAMGLSGNAFKKVAPAIAKKTNRKVYVPDVRNHGSSPWTKEINYDILVNDILEFMQQNNIPKAIFVGSSMGGRIGINIALKYPHKVEALVVEDMTPRNIVSSGFNVLRAVAKFIEDTLNSFPPDTELNEAKIEVVEMIMNLVPHLCRKDKVLQNYDPDYVAIVKEGERIKVECNMDAVLGMLENDALVQNLPDLDATFNGDVLFLYGTKGFFNLGRDPSIKKLFPKAIIKRIQDSSHLIHFDSPEEYTNIVSYFIQHRSLSLCKY